MSKYIKKKKGLARIRPEAIYALIVVLAIIITVICQRSMYEKQMEEINVSFEEQIAALRAEYESQIVELKQYYEYGGDITQIELEAEYIAKVVYGTAYNHAESDKRAVVWCILNRVEHYAHPDTIIEVCEQPKQWMGYSSGNPVLADIYDLVMAELKIWYGGGHRPVSNEYIYLTWSSREILLRDSFEENKSTNYWRMR